MPKQVKDKAKVAELEKGRLKADWPNIIDKLTELLSHACQARYPQMSAREAALEAELQQWWHERQLSQGHLNGPRFTIDELKEALAAMEKR